MLWKPASFRRKKKKTSKKVNYPEFPLPIPGKDIKNRHKRGIFYPVCCFSDQFMPAIWEMFAGGVIHTLTKFLPASRPICVRINSVNAGDSGLPVETGFSS
jgi:hypothetical protein